MRRLLGVSLLVALLSSPSLAQTTGIPGINDFTVNGFVSGSTSCTLVVQVGQPITFNINTVPGALSVIVLNTCPCAAGLLPLAPIGCQGALLNQSIDLDIFGWTGALCLTLQFPGTANTAGNFGFTMPPCPNPFRFSAQGVILIPGCAPFVMTQAYDIQC